MNAKIIAPTTMDRTALTARLYDSIAAFNQVACWDILRLAQMRQYLAEHLAADLMDEAARRNARPATACEACGDLPAQWCPDCAACRSGCWGGHVDNPCAHPNAPWEATSCDRLPMADAARSAAQLARLEDAQSVLWQRRQDGAP
ncbi:MULTISPECIES: hypothetical protein [unclassified Streptomyces]|uniref:hypothetical protein n=1 Tax=unclassified Streptomyces TaxID=2593676 RepID=UPI003809A95A